MKNIVIILFLLVGVLPCTAQELVWEIFPENTTGLGRIEFLPDGERFINNGNGQIQVRSLEDGRLLDSIVDPEGATYIIGFSDDETRLITSTVNVGLKVYDSQTFEFLHQIKIPKYENPNDDRMVADYHGVTNLHYSPTLGKIYIIQKILASANEVDSFGNKWFNQYNERFFVTDISGDIVYKDTIFFTEGVSEMNTYKYGGSGKFAVAPDGTVIINTFYTDKWPYTQIWGLHYYKDDLKTYKYVKDDNLENDYSENRYGTPFFATFDNGKKLLRVFDKAFSHPTLGDINFLIYDIESEKLVDGFFEKDANWMKLQKDSLIISLIWGYPIINLNQKKEIFRLSDEQFVKRLGEGSALKGYYILHAHNIFKYIVLLKYEYDFLLNVDDSFINEELIGAISPTPNNGTFTLNIKNLEIGNLKITLSDLIGKTIQVIYNAYYSMSTFDKTVDISSLSNGTYLLRIENNGNILTKSILKGE